MQRHAVPCETYKKPRPEIVTFSANCQAKTLELFDKKVKQRRYRTRSEAVDEALTCWVYLRDEKCEKCPYYGGDNADGETSNCQSESK